MCVLEFFCKDVCVRYSMCARIDFSVWECVRHFFCVGMCVLSYILGMCVLVSCVGMCVLSFVRVKMCVYVFQFGDSCTRVLVFCVKDNFAEFFVRRSLGSTFCMRIFNFVFFCSNFVFFSCEHVFSVSEF